MGEGMTDYQFNRFITALKGIEKQIEELERQIEEHKYQIHHLEREISILMGEDNDSENPAPNAPWRYGI